MKIKNRKGNFFFLPTFNIKREMISLEQWSSTWDKEEGFCASSSKGKLATSRDVFWLSP